MLKKGGGELKMKILAFPPFSQIALIQRLRETKTESFSSIFRLRHPKPSESIIICSVKRKLLTANLKLFIRINFYFKFFLYYSFLFVFSFKFVFSLSFYVFFFRVSVCKIIRVDVGLAGNFFVGRGTSPRPRILLVQ